MSGCFIIDIRNFQMYKSWLVGYQCPKNARTKRVVFMRLGGFGNGGIKAWFKDQIIDNNSNLNFQKDILGLFLDYCHLIQDFCIKFEELKVFYTKIQN